MATLKEVIEKRQALDAKIKGMDAETKVFKDKRTKLDGLIGTKINKGEEGTRSLTVAGILCYAKSTVAYSLQPDGGRAMLEEWVLAPLGDDIPHEAKVAVLERMAIFKNDPVKAVVDQHRIDTGAEDVSTARDSSTILEGGELPPGIKMFNKESVGFRKA